MEQIVYTCPMHPQIKQDKPGSCPICGMALEPLLMTRMMETNPELKDMQHRFWICLCLSIPVVILSMGMDMPFIANKLHLLPSYFSPFIQWLLTTIIVMWGAYPFFQKGWGSIVHRHLNMFTLISMGVGISYIYSTFAWIFADYFPSAFHGKAGNVHLYFESAAIISVLVLLGQVLELRGRERTSLAIQSLLNLIPKKALLIRSDQSEILVPIDELKINDIVKIKPGEKIPSDGVIISGHSSLDESMISGESLPIEKQTGDKVIGGTLNLIGVFTMKIKRVGKETLLAQIIEQVTAAQRSKAPIQKLVDIVSGFFVPLVIVIAIFTFFVWLTWGPKPAALFGLMNAISVLIIACPCALDLATPMSIMVGMGKGALAGILIKDASSLERFAKVNVLVIDKTGTLTLGKPNVKSIVTNKLSENELLLMAASLSHNSEHPLSSAIVEAAKQEQLKLLPTSEFHYVVGKGVSGTVQDKKILIGNVALLSANGIPLHDWEKRALPFLKEGNTVIYIAINNELSGLIAIGDQIKPSAISAIQLLKKEKLSVIMLTGDNELTAKSIAKQIGITRFEANVLPQDKNLFIKKLKSAGNIVAMAGDGINDAPALAEADVSIAMGNGTDVAINTANITLIQGDLLGLVRARKLSKIVMRNIKQNLFLAFVYNGLCIPIAAGILYPWTGWLLNPIIAAAAMSLSSFSVIANALRLRFIPLKTK